MSFLSRRRFSALMMAPLLTALAPRSVFAKPEPWKKRLKQIVSDIKPVEGKVSIELPALASHGNMVPVKVSVTSPMTDQDYIEAITLMSNKAKEPVLAEVRFSPQSGKAEFSTNLRLRENQEIMALAKTNEGKFFIGRRQALISPETEF